MIRYAIWYAVMTLLLVGCGGETPPKPKSATPKPTLSQANSAPAENQAVGLHESLAHDPLPNGYTVATKDIVVDGKLLGQMIEVTKSGHPSKVAIQIQNHVETSAAARRAAAKGYVNGFATALSKAGYKVANKKLPDISREEFKEPIAVDMEFTKDSGDKLLTRLLIFFTDNGYSVQVVGDNEDSVATLNSWAKSIRPK